MDSLLFVVRQFVRVPKPDLFVAVGWASLIGFVLDFEVFTVYIRMSECFVSAFYLSLF